MSSGILFQGVVALTFTQISSIFGLLHLLAVHELSNSQTLAFALTVILTSLVLFAVIWGVRHRDQAIMIVESIAKKWFSLFHRPYVPGSAETSLLNLFDAWDVLMDKGWHRTTLGAILNVFFDMLTLYFLFVAAGYTISPGVLFVGYGIPLLLGKMAFVIPGGVGVVEASMVGLYTGLGVTESVAVVVGLIYRAISFWLPTLIGFPIAAYLQQATIRSQR